MVYINGRHIEKYLELLYIHENKYPTYQIKGGVVLTMYEWRCFKSHKVRSESFNIFIPQIEENTASKNTKTQK